MTEKPRSTLSLKRASTPITEAKDSTSKPLQRTGKRIIKRDALPTDNLAKPKAKPLNPSQKKRPTKPKARPKPKPLYSPSDLRAQELNASLNGFSVWLQQRPLALGIERQIFQYIAKHSLPASKRVVQKLLHQHTRSKAYLLQIAKGGKRFNFDGSEAGQVLAHEQEAALLLVRPA
jgi:hypothetical protein